MNFRTWAMAGGLILAPWFSGCALAEPPRPIASTGLSQWEAIVPSLEVAFKPDRSKLGQALQDQLFRCVRKKVSTLSNFALEQMQGLSMECVFEVVVLDAKGKIRPDANERMMALVEVTGVVMPKPASQGQASVTLQPLAGSRVWTIGVNVANQNRPFLLDTGASSSIVDNQIAKQLGLKGTPIPDRLMSYMVVGEECSGLNANLYPLPKLMVESAQVRGLTGLGLARKSIPGNQSGVLGLDFLSNFDLVLNPQSRQLQLLPPSRPVANGVPLVGKLGIMTTQISINGKGPFNFALDSGADVMVLSERLSKRLTLDPKKMKLVQVRGFCGLENGKQTQLAQVRMQTHTATRLDAVVLKSEPLDLLGVDGIVGQNFLNQYRQHWRFGERDTMGYPARGSLELEGLAK
ncbi:MAG: retropepsin-like aspartic protease [Leptolyngbyaceae cyanobacterium bins.59]|nr:retropepsin-like aspartic protease [Leptolyngbyaceae cyanobacterium bins.59]